MRFQSTAQMAMHDTGSKYDGLESMSERAERLRERKINNTRTSIHFGSGPGEKMWKTTARANDDYDRGVVMAMAGSDGGAIQTPAEMKRKLAGSNFELGDHGSRDWDRASTLADPTGPEFLKYRGVLNKEVADAIKSSSLAFGFAEGGDYQSTAHAGMVLRANDIDYAGDFARAKALKKALTTSNISFDTDEARGLNLYETTSAVSMAYDAAAARTASGQMDEGMKKDLRMQHFKFGFSEHGYETDVQAREKKVALAVNARRRQILAAAGPESEGQHPDLLMMQEDRKQVKALKDSLLRTSIIIGDDADYL